MANDRQRGPAPTAGLYDGDPPHHLALELAASRALAAGEYGAAFALADRRCRIRPAPEAHSFVQRAEAAWGLGEKRGALADLAEALMIAPDDIAASRRELRWAVGKRRERAAASLVANDHDPAVLRRALAVSRKAGRRSCAVVTVLDDAVRGWAAWSRDGRVDVTVEAEGQSVTVTLDADPFHPLSGSSLRAAAFRLPRPPSSVAATVRVADAEGVFHSERMRPNRAAEEIAPKAAKEEPGTVTVIVPVYADYAATRRCLEILVRELERDPSHRAVIIDDTAPDPRMARYLSTLSGNPSVTVLTNASNLGFVASVNRGIAVSGGDLILLNADTIPPADFIARLAAAARQAPYIGAVVPLSNNAELTSFPLPGVANPLAGAGEAARLDDLAAATASPVVDIPAGTGFCLYVTRACLAATGGLHESFHRGYLEDVDFCLRAREAGFRTVCDPSVYVGHVGSRSFGVEKASLVARNFRILEQRFPDYRRECEAFGIADPLRPARAAIELAALRDTGPTTLVLAAAGWAATARRRGEQLAKGARKVVLAEVHGTRVALAALDGGMPQSLVFDLCEARGAHAMSEALKIIGVDAVEIVGAALSADRLPALDDLPMDLLVAEEGVLAMAGQARAINAPSEAARHFAFTRLDRRNRRKLKLEPSPPRRVTRRTAGERVGVLALRASRRELELAEALARLGRNPIVIGESSDDRRLMDRGIWVTGPVTPGELRRVARACGVGWLVTGLGSPLFLHPLLSAAEEAGLSMAFPDWSDGRCPAAPGDLAYDAGGSTEAIATAIAQWATCA